MRLVLLTLISLLLIGMAPACVDAAGNRVTLRQWWDDRLGNRSSEPSEATASRPSTTTRPDAPERSDAEVARRSAPAAESATPAEGAATGYRAARPPRHAIQADALEIDGRRVVTVEQILEPLMPQLREMAAVLPAAVYYDRATELVRRRLRDVMSLHLIYRRAGQRITAEMEPQISKAVERMERDRINREFNGLETRYTQFLRKQGKTREEAREQLRKVVVVDSYLQDRLYPMIPEPRKRELLDYYKSHRSDYSRPERRELFLIDIPCAAFLGPEARPDDLPLAVQKAREAIEAAARELAEGKPFEEVARRYSQGPHRADGGAWGDITSPMAGRWQAPYARFLQMKEGEISEIIEVDHPAPHGHTVKTFFIVKAGRIEPATVRSFRDAQPEIIRILKHESFQRLRARFLQKEFDRATIDSLNAFGELVMRSIPEPAQANGGPAISPP
ncbi:MAG: peptidylprolyl isomerase [Phycisphaerae bacterium]